MPAIAAAHVTKVFGHGETEVMALKDVNLAVEPGELVALMGPSGSGKTTLLRALSLIDPPSRGCITIGDEEICADVVAKVDDRRLRREKVGIIFQAYNLIPFLTAAENVALVLTLNGVSRSEALRRARALLQNLDLAHRTDTYPGTLSGGEQQRLAVARAVINNPAVILADEPTANLDGENAEVLMHLMRDLRDRRGMTFMFSTHDPRVVTHAVRVVTLVDGRVAHDETTPGEAPHEILPGIGKPPVAAGT